MDWAWQIEHGEQPALPGKSPYQYKSDLDKEVKEQVTKGIRETGGKPPRVLIIGSLGRCGRGAIECCLQAGLSEENILQWDLAETSHGGPFVEIRQVQTLHLVMIFWKYTAIRGNTERLLLILPNRL